MRALDAGRSEWSGVCDDVMGFMLNKMEVGLTPPIEYRAVTANEDVVLGEALALSAGKLTKCGATARPEYVAVGPKDDAGIAPVVRVQDYMEFETTLSAAPAEGVTPSGDGHHHLRRGGHYMAGRHRGGRPRAGEILRLLKKIKKGEAISAFHVSNLLGKPRQSLFAEEEEEQRSVAGFGRRPKRVERSLQRRRGLCNGFHRLRAGGQYVWELSVSHQGISGEARRGI